MTEINRDLVCVLIPTLNEKATIGPVIEELKALGYNNILVADGRSTDGTPEIAEKLGSRLHIYKNLGHAAYEEAKNFNKIVYNFLTEK